MAQAQGFSKHLLSHSIFKTCDDDNAFRKKFGDFNGQGNKKINQLCTRGNDLFIAVGNTVRCVDISSNATGGYKNLNVATVEFGIVGLVINNAGTLMAIVGEDCVVACVLPPSGAVSGPDRILKVKCREVGTVPRSKVLKVAWNPIARYDSNLMILTSNGYLRAYDLSLSYETPEFEYCFNESQNENSDDYGVDYGTIEDPVSFALGSASDPHGKLTCYVLTRDGDIFGLCPWLPNQFVMSKQEIEDLFDNAVSQEYEYRQVKKARIEVKRHYKHQLAWASSVWKQLSTSMVETKLEEDGMLHDLHILKRPEKPLQEPQGPFSFNPFPNELYDGDAVDIVTLDAGAMTAIAASFTSGRVNFYLQDTSLEMKWKGSQYNDQSIDLATMESVKLNGTNSGLYVDNKQSLCVFAISDHNAYRLDISRWAVPLTAAIESGDIHQVEAVIEEHSALDQINLVSKQDRTVLKGVCILEDEIGNQYSVTKTDLGLWIEHWTETAPPSVPTAAIDQGGSSVGAPFASSSSATDKEQQLAIGNGMNYESLLSKSSINQEIGRLLGNVELNPPPPSFKGQSTVDKIQPTIEDFEYFVKLVDFYSDGIGGVYEAGKAVHTRLASQRSELRRQLTKLGELADKIDYIRENRTPARLQEAVERQEKIQKRAEALLQQMGKSRELPLSDQEKKWFIELKRLQQKIYNSGGLAQRVHNSLVQADVISKEVRVLDKADHQTPTTSALEQDSIARLQVLLAKESEIVESTKQHLKRLLNDIELSEGIENLHI